MKERKVTKYKIISIEKTNYNKDKLRRIDSNKNKSQYFVDNYIKEIEFIDTDEDENKELELREYYNDKSNNNNDSQNSSNINQYKQSYANIEGQNLKNSNKIISTHMEINEELGLIKLVNIFETVKLNTNSEEEDELNSNKVINSKNEINEYSLNSLEDEISENTTSKNEKINTNIDSKFDTMLYIINSSIVNKDKYININEKRVKILKEEFNKYQYNLYNQTDYGNKTMRILNSMSKYISKQNSIEKKIIVEDIPIEEYKKQKKNAKIRKLLENYGDIYYGLKNIDVTKNAFKTNILGLKLEGYLENKINHREGTTTSYFHSYFGNTKISYSVGDIETNLHIITKNINEMTKDFIYLINNSLENLIKRSENYAEIILNLENNISEMLSGKNLYDFSKLLKSPLDEMYIKVKNFTNILFRDLILLIEQSHKNYTLLQTKIKNDNLNSLKQIKEITKNEYIEYINSSINNLEIFSNKTLEYLRILENLTKNITSFTIDILYDIIDNIEEAEIIFKNFCYFLFNSISKGIKFFKNKLNYHIEETIGELLYIPDFISNGLKNDNLLMNAIDEKKRNSLIIKLKDFRKIINIIINSIIEDISNDYFNEMLNSNPKSAKSLTENESLQLLTNIQNNSFHLISSIKLKILFIEKYELYSFNIDQINNINYNIQNNFYENTYEKIMKEVLNIKPQFLNESSKIIKNKNILFNLSIKIKNVINNEINEINNYIDIYSNKYKDENIYNLSINLYYFSKSFLEKSMKELLNDFFCLINDTISINLKSIIKYNYDLGFQYLNEENELFETYKDELNLWDKAMNFILSGKLKLTITNKFISKSTKFLEYTKNFISLVHSEELLNIFEKYFYHLKDEILNYVKNKLLLINKYYFESEQYSNKFHFISQILSEILRQIDNINKYYNDETFNGKVKLHITTLIQNILIDYDAKLQDSFYTSFQSLMGRSGSIKDKDDDFCWIKRRFIFFKKTHCYYTEHTNYLNLLVNNLIQTEIYIKDYKKKIFSQFTNKLEEYLDNIINISNRLYNNLYSFTEEKIKNNKNLEVIISDYHNIIYNMINNNSNKNLLNEIYFINQNEKIKNNIDTILNGIEDGLKKIKNEYYKIYYINNKTEFLEYPYEIIIKCNQILNELDNSKNYIKSSINFIYKERVKNIIKETNLFIKDINENNFLYIISHLNLSYIFYNYSNEKKNYLRNEFHNLNENLNISNNEALINKEDTLNDLNYNNKFKIMIQNTINFLDEFNSSIYTNFTKLICINDTNIINNNSSNYDTNDKYNNKTKRNCNLIYYESKLNYSKYNFQIVKIRNSIYYTKNLYIELNDIYKNELNNDKLIYELINIQNIKDRDEILNSKNKWKIYNESLSLINNLNKETKQILKDYYEYFNESFINKYSIKNEINKKIFLENIQILNNTLRNKNEDIKAKINDNLNIINNFLRNNLNEYHQIFYNIFSQINTQIIYKYNFYGINEEKFNQTFINFYNLISNVLEEYYNSTISLYNNPEFHNSFSYAIKRIFNTQFKKYGENIKHYSERFNFKLLNISIDLDKFILDILRKEYEDFEFSFIYDYAGLFEEYETIYQKNLSEKIFKLKDKYLKEMKKEYESFLKKIKNINNYRPINFIYELRKNQTNCSNYALKSLDTILFEDKINWEKYQKYIKLIELNSLNNTDFNQNEIEYSEKIDYFNITNHWLYCYDNNFFNYSNIIVEDIDEINKLLINNITNDIIEAINNNKLDGKFLENYFYEKFFLNINNNNNLLLEDLDNLYSSFEDFQAICEYLSYTIDKRYKTGLKEIFIRNFNISYSNFIEKYLINEIDSKIYIDIFEKINMKIDYIKKKLIEENNYYLFLLNKTKNLSISTKEALLSLYPTLFIRINNILHQIFNKVFEENIYFYLMENRKIFLENYLNFLNNNQGNKNSLEIVKFNEFFDGIISDINFNRTLENISERLIINMINLLKNKYISSLEEKLNNINDLLLYLKNQIEKSLTNINILNYSDYSISIANINKNYTELINQQNNEFIFNVSDKPFIALDNFTLMYLRNPLSEIKDTYSKIEKDLLNNLFNQIYNFDDFYGFIKDKLNKEKKIEDIENIYNITNNLIDNYTESFSNEIFDIKNQLYEYTNINGLKQNNKIIRNLNETNISNKKQLNFFESNYQINSINKYKNINHKKENNNYKNKKGYFNYHNKFYNRILDSSIPQGSYNIYHIIQVFKTANQIFSIFSKTISSSEFKKIPNNLNLFIMKNENFLIRLESSIKLSLLRFSTFLTSEKLLELEKNIYYQYNLINPYITEYLKEIYNNTVTFINFINSTALYYDKIFIGLNSTILSNYQELSNLINNKYNVKSNGIFLRNLEFSKAWSLPISLTFNILDLLNQINVDINDKVQKDICKKGPFKIKIGLDLFIGFGLELGWEWENGLLNQTSRKFYVDLYGESSASIFAELGLYFKVGNYEFNFGGGVKINLGDFKDGMKYEKSNGVESSKKHQLNLYSEISTLKIDVYIYIEFKFEIKIKNIKIPMTIRVDFVKELYEGFKYKIYEITPKNTKLFISTLASKLLIIYPPGSLGYYAFVSSYFVIGYISKKDKI